MQLTESRDLRGGRSPWMADTADAFHADPFPTERVEIAIIGAGVMGTMLAERLTSESKEVLLLDRRPPAQGSTAASTALVMWGADVPLTHLARQIGEDEAARRWRRAYTAVRNLAVHIDSVGIECGRIERPELYLAGTLLDETALGAESEARRRAGLPSSYMEAAAVSARFDIAPRAGLLSEGCYEVDPVRLTLGILDRARRQGASACFPVDVVGVVQRDDAILITTSDGRAIEAGQVILATGYERPTWFLPSAFTVGSSYAIATLPGTAPLWRENALIWEALSPYLYARAAADGRVIAGGEDEDFADASQRDALIGSKSGVIATKLAKMIDVAKVDIDCAWSAAFGASPDGLPAIGRAANHERLWLASGFGGNGVTFAALGAELIAAEMAGDPDPDAACFNPYRFS
jgi:glycine/D-amino acid oxidase-like deaminating enzyme